MRYLEQLRRFTSERINYFKDVHFYVDARQSVVDTRFFVNHSAIAEKLERLGMNENTWPLGPLSSGMEWFAVTFRSQPQRGLTIEDLEQLLADQDGIVKEAYARMLLDSSHKWMKDTSAEVDRIVAELSLEPGATLLDAGCGIGRHAIELAKRGYRVVGVDFVQSLVGRATQAAQEAGVGEQVQFRAGDCRDLNLGTQFDGAICLYDVVGSFPRDEDNKTILQGVARHIKPNGRLLMSVLNRGLVEAQAIHRGAIGENLDTLRQLPPSSTMQKSGEIFDPRYYFYDNITGVVYRKEQFIFDNNIPCELIVRDRRYTASELQSLCLSVGIEPIWTRHVRMGQWDDDRAADDLKAKEVLLLGKSR
ncbi:MAG TPA: methyltransferase domain-containing protein [Gemmataceae bacterium]|nr:methyltransferase domain-containing protein [Gemmataceae bacterium]